MSGPRQDYHKLDISRGTKAACRKEAGKAVGGTHLVCVEYYTAKKGICKVSKVTKLGGNFR